MTKHDGGPAFPAIPGDMKQGPCCYWGGMSLRDWFAGQAMEAWIIALSRRVDEPGYDDESAAKHAAYLAGVSADAMLAAGGHGDE